MSRENNTKINTHGSVVKADVNWTLMGQSAVDNVLRADAVGVMLYIALLSRNTSYYIVSRVTKVIQISYSCSMSLSATKKHLVETKQGLISNDGMGVR